MVTGVDTGTGVIEITGVTGVDTGTGTGTGVGPSG